MSPVQVVTVCMSGYVDLCVLLCLSTYCCDGRKAVMSCLFCLILCSKIDLQDCQASEKVLSKKDIPLHMENQIREHLNWMCISLWASTRYISEHEDTWPL